MLQIGAKKGRASYCCKSIANALLKKPRPAVLMVGTSYLLAADFIQLHRYAPIEGEAAAIAWALEKCCMFVLGCPNIIVVTDHEPLKGLFGDWDLSKIQNPRLFQPKEKSLRYRLTNQHYSGKWHRGSDAVSRYPVAIVQALLNVYPSKSSQLEIQEPKNKSDIIESTALMATFACSNNIALISPDLICATGRGDPQYEKLISVIQQGFPRTHNLTAPEVYEYWEMRYCLTLTMTWCCWIEGLSSPKHHREKSCTAFILHTKE